LTDKDLTCDNLKIININNLDVESGNKLDNEVNLLSAYCKTHLHLLNELKKYDYLMWVEQYMTNCESIFNKLLSVFDNKHDFYTFKINLYDLRQLYLRNVIYKNYPNSLLKKQIKKYASDNYQNNILYETDFVLFRNSSSNVKFFNYWWLETINGNILDELTFTNLIKIHNIKIKFSDGLLTSENNLLNKKNILTQKCPNTKINFIDKILWINLDRSIDRKIHMENLLKNINVPNSRVSAIDGSKFNFLNNLKNANLAKARSKYENACLLSHLKAITSLKNESGNYFLICEDDISFENIFLLDDDLKNIIQNSPTFDILMIHKIWYRKIPKIYVEWKNYFFENKENISSTAGYIISRIGIEKICSEVNIIDDVFTFNKHNMLDNADIYLYKYVDTFVYKYNFISTLEKNSTIHNDHLEQQINSKNYQLRVICDDIFN
jgi:GR25 family glycosyltransferase involved in LPS biosynthesis